MKHATNYRTNDRQCLVSMEGEANRYCASSLVQRSSARLVLVRQLKQLKKHVAKKSNV